MSLLEILGRVRRTLKSAVGATYVHVMLYDAALGAFVLLPADSLLASVRAAAQTAFDKLGGRTAPNGLRRVDASRCGAVHEAVSVADVVNVADVTTDARFSGPADWLAAQDLLDAALGVLVETTSMLAAPVVMESTGDVAAVILVTNKRAAAAEPVSPPSPPQHGAHAHSRSHGSELDSFASATEGDDAIDYDDGGVDSDTDWHGSDDRGSSPTGGGGPALASESWSAVRRASKHLTSMRRWSLAQRPATARSSVASPRLPAVQESARRVFASSSSAAMGARRSSLASRAARHSGVGKLALHGHELVLGREPPSRRPRRAAARASAVHSFSDRDVRVVAGLAASLALALEDRRLEFETLVGARDYTLLAAIRDPVRVFVDFISGIPLPGAAAARRAAAAAAAASSARSPQPLTPTGASGSTAGSPRSRIRSLAGGGVVCAMLLVHGSEVLSTTKSPVCPLVRRGLVAQQPCDSSRCASAPPPRPPPLQVVSETDKTVATASWSSPLESGIRYFNLPVATRAIFIVTMRDGSALGWAGVNLFTPEQVRC